jgi:formylglycine-generating enzyme required for sulfatase activity
MRFQVIPPVAVQEAALAEGKPLSFLMGSRGYRPEEEPRHRVVIPRPFYLGTFPVTQEEFACFRPQHLNHFHGKPKHPVENVSWDDAREFLVWLGKKARDLPRGFVPRLPCEAEWEYACRAGTETDYYNGDGEGALRQVGWHGEGLETGGTHAVGEKKEKHPWGLHDMHGNVLEWCDDVWDGKAYAKRRGGWMARAWSDADAGADAERDDGMPLRVLRGGSWNYVPDWCRAAFRDWRHPGNRCRVRGFRVFLGLPGPAEPEKPSGGPEAVREREGGTTDLATGRPEVRPVKMGTKRVSESVKG